MKKINLATLSRIAVTAALILIQCFWLGSVILDLYEQSDFANAVVEILSVVFAIYIVNVGENPDFKIGWLVLIMAVPVFGVTAYFLFGNSKPTRFMKRKMDESHGKLKPFMYGDDGVLEELEKQQPRLAATCKYIQNAADFPVYKNTDVKYYSVGEDMYADMLEAIQSAREFIFLEYFIVEEGEMWRTIRNLLVEKAKEGVKVRMMYDDMGSVALLPYGYYKQMEALHPNIECMAFNHVVPFIQMAMNNRDHRKILVVDGKIGFNGGINLADEYINQKKQYHWKDTGIRLEGSGVWNLTAMFLEMWNAYRKENDGFEKYRKEFPGNTDNSKGFVQSYGDAPLDDIYVGEDVYIDILNGAQDYVYIFTPYLIIDSKLRSAIEIAAKRGVDVRIVTPGIPDKKMVFRITRSNYKPLLKCGVKIYEYTPGFIHAKSVVSDDRVGIVGSINLDYRSLYHHFEGSTIFYCNDAVFDLKKDCIETMKKSHPITFEDIKGNVFGRAFDSVLKIFETLL